MNAVDKIIYNALLRGESVNIPDVGNLRIVRHNASRDKSGAFVAPRREIVWTAEIDADGVSVISKIMDIGGIGEPQARSIYDGWIADSRKDGRTTIDGVCSVADGKVETDAAFASRINPPEPPHKSGKGWIIWPIVVLVLLCCAVVVNMYWSDVSYFFTTLTHREQATEQVQLSEDTLAVAETYEQPDTAVVQDLGVEPEQQSAPAAPATTVTSSGAECYMVIAGTFRSESNALHELSTVQHELGFAKSKIIKNDKGMFLVAVGESATEAGADALLAKVKQSVSGAWVFHSTPQNTLEK